MKRIPLSLTLKIITLSTLFALSVFTQTRNVTLNWNHTDPTVSFNLYRAPADCASNPTNFAKINAAPITTKSYTDSAVAYGVYCYRATATANGRESIPSNTAEAAVDPKEPTGLQTVINVAVQVTPDGVVTASMQVTGPKRTQ